MAFLLDWLTYILEPISLTFLYDDNFYTHSADWWMKKYQNGLTQ